MADNHIIRKHARGTSEALSQYSGPAGEVVVDTTLSTLRVQNGTAGGMPLARKLDLDATAASMQQSIEQRVLFNTPPVDAVYARGCYLYRSANGIATTIEAVQPDGVTALKFEVIDAAYRGSKIQFGAYGQENPDLQFFADSGGAIDFRIDRYNVLYNRSVLPSYVNIFLLVAYWGNTLNNLESAQFANDSWYTRFKDTTDINNIKGVPAVEYCRNLTNDNGGWLLPNIWELMILFVLSDELDVLDPTAADNPALMFGYKGINTRFSFDSDWAALSCTLFNLNGVRGVDNSARCNIVYRSNKRAAIPIRELSVSDGYSFGGGRGVVVTNNSLVVDPEYIRYKADPFSEVGFGYTISDGLLLTDKVLTADPVYIRGVMNPVAGAVFERGCRLYRSANGIATTIDALGPDGMTPLKFEVIDAAYRRNDLKFGAYSQYNTDLQAFNSKGSNAGWHIDGNATAPDQYLGSVLSATYNMRLLVSKWGAVYAGVETAQFANNSWYTRFHGITDGQGITGVPAIEYCRGLTNDSGGWLLPNIWELLILFILADKLDELDPTVADNVVLRLGFSSGKFRFDFSSNKKYIYAHSCTYSSSTQTRSIMHNSRLTTRNRNDTGGVVPIRELSV